MGDKKKYIALGIALACVAFLAVMAFKQSLSSEPTSVSSNASSSAITSIASSTEVTKKAEGTAKVTDIGVTGTGNFTVKPTLAIPTPPNFKKQLVCAVNIPYELCAKFQSDAAVQASILTKDPTSLKAWINLGSDRKHAGDFEGAAAALEYASLLNPINVVSFNNLGDLYMNFIHDYPKAESNYLKQIVNKPGDINAYRALFTLYTELYKQNTSAAVDILKRGIAANPQSTDLKYLLDTYHR